MNTRDRTSDTVDAPRRCVDSETLLPMILSTILPHANECLLHKCPCETIPSHVNLRGKTEHPKESITGPWI